MIVIETLVISLSTGNMFFEAVGEFIFVGSMTTDRFTLRLPKKKSVFVRY